MKQLQNMLGLLIREQTIAVSEIERAGDSYTIRRCATYRLAEGVTLETLSAASAGFKAFLKEQGFASKKAVVGVPAGCTLSTHLKIPPISDVRVRHDTIKLQLERKMHVDFSDIVFDYDDSQETGEDGIWVMMILKKTVSQIRQLLAASKIVPVRIVNTLFAFEPERACPAGCHVIDFPDALECCLFRHGIPAAVWPLSKTDNAPLDAQLAQKITRHVSRTFWLSADPHRAVHYSLWTGEALSDIQKVQLQHVFGAVDYKKPKVSSGHFLCDLAAESAGRALTGQAGGINFLNGRHTEAKPPLLKRQFRKIAAAAAAVLIGILVFAAGWHSDRRQAAQLRAQLESMKENVEAANSMIDEVGYAKQWFRGQPRYLDILRELSLAFPENEDIWLTSLAVDESFNQILTGRTTREETILDMAETLRANRLFEDIKILYIRNTGKGTNVMTFAINLRCREEQ